MTEAEWLAAKDPLALMNATQVRVTPRTHRLLGQDIELKEVGEIPLLSLSSRKMRLFGVGCCWLASSRLTDVFVQLLIEVEQQVDEDDGASELPTCLVRAKEELERANAGEQKRHHWLGGGKEAESVVLLTNPTMCPQELGETIADNLSRSAGALAHNGGEDRYPPEMERAERAESAAQTVIFRDIFGNPFRPVALDPAWLTSDVRILAEGIYQERAFDRMPILADALQDAGCDNADVLNHCRGDGPHVRGCWVVDLVLDKS